MATIKQPIQDILTKLTSILVNNGDGNTVGLYARLWNNQYNFEKEGKYIDYPKPAAFLEVVLPVTYESIGQGYRSADVGFKVHIIHEFYNQDGTFEQDLAIFDLRDAVIGVLDLYCPTGCGPLEAISEEQDYSHDNTNDYSINFLCNFTDSAGAVDKNFQTKQPPTNLDLTVQGQEYLSITT